MQSQALVALENMFHLCDHVPVFSVHGNSILSQVFLRILRETLHQLLLFTPAGVWFITSVLVSGLEGARYEYALCHIVAPSHQSEASESLWLCVKRFPSLHASVSRALRISPGLDGLGTCTKPRHIIGPSHQLHQLESEGSMAPGLCTKPCCSHVSSRQSVFRSFVAVPVSGPGGTWSSYDTSRQFESQLG